MRRFLFLLFGLNFVLVSFGQNQNTTFKISMDSASLLMGKQTMLHMEISEPQQNGQGIFLVPEDTLSRFIEVAKVLPADTVKGNGSSGRLVIKKNMIIQSFDSGLYQIGPLYYLTPSGDTVKSNPLSLKVIPVMVDSLETIHGDAPVFNVESRWWDFVPDIILDNFILFLVLLFCIILVVAGIFLWISYRNKGRLPFVAKPKPIPPYELAVTSLNELRDRHLWEEGREKEFYTELIDILRRYLEGRFNINAMEMTTGQILHSLQNNPEINHHKDLMKRILDTADFVKFANMRPLPSDNTAAWETSMKFVEDTKPVAIEEKDSSEDDESVINEKDNKE